MPPRLALLPSQDWDAGGKGRVVSCPLQTQRPSASMIHRAHEDVQEVSRLSFREISFNSRTSDAWSVTTSATVSRAHICGEAVEYLAQAVLRCDNMRDIVTASEGERGTQPAEFPQDKDAFMSFKWLQGRCFSCWRRPTTMPGAMPCSSANWRTSDRVNNDDPTNSSQ